MQIFLTSPCTIGRLMNGSNVVGTKEGPKEDGRGRERGTERSSPSSSSSSCTKPSEDTQQSYTGKPTYVVKVLKQIFYLCSVGQFILFCIVPAK